MFLVHLGPVDFHFSRSSAVAKKPSLFCTVMGDWLGERARAFLPSSDFLLLLFRSATMFATSWSSAWRSVILRERREQKRRYACNKHAKQNRVFSAEKFFVIYSARTAKDVKSNSTMSVEKSKNEQPINQSINQSIEQSIKRSTCQPINQSINQCITQSNESIYQSHRHLCHAAKNIQKGLKVNWMWHNNEVKLFIFIKFCGCRGDTKRFSFTATIFCRATKKNRTITHNERFPGTRAYG